MARRRTPDRATRRRRSPPPARETAADARSPDHSLFQMIGKKMAGESEHVGSATFQAGAAEIGGMHHLRVAIALRLAGETATGSPRWAAETPTLAGPARVPPVRSRLPPGGRPAPPGKVDMVDNCGRLSSRCVWAERINSSETAAPSIAPASRFAFAHCALPRARTWQSGRAPARKLPAAADSGRSAHGLRSAARSKRATGGPATAAQERPPRLQHVDAGGKVRQREPGGVVSKLPHRCIREKRNHTKNIQTKKPRRSLGSKTTGPEQRRGRGGRIGSE